jgi:RHS repeat-associated protein
VKADYPDPAHNRAYTYDKVGNRITQTSVAATKTYIHEPSSNRLLEVRKNSPTGPLLFSFTYDDNGNRIEKRDGNNALLQVYAYDQKNRITSMAHASLTQASQTYDFTYDPNDYRIQKSSSDNTRKYLLQAEHLEAIYDENNNLAAKFLRGVVVDEIVNGYYYDDQGQNTNYTFFHDPLQSLTGLGDHQGNVVETTAYGPFGEIYTQNGESPNTLKYTGREHDDESGLYYYRARYYDPDVGRFLTEDPKGFEAGVNFYAYVLNNPINANDPMGLVEWKAFRKGLYSTVGGVFFIVSGAATSPTGVGLLYSVPAVLGGSAAVGWGKAQMLAALMDHEIPFMGLKEAIIKNTIDPGLLQDELLGINTLTDMLSGGRIAPSNIGTINTVFQNILSIYDSGSTIMDAVGGASGGFVLYPNKANSNMVQQVYNK